MHDVITEETEMTSRIQKFVSYTCMITHPINNKCNDNNSWHLKKKRNERDGSSLPFIDHVHCITFKVLVQIITV